MPTSAVTALTRTMGVRLRLAILLTVGAATVGMSPAVAAPTLPQATPVAQVALRTHRVGPVLIGTPLRQGEAALRALLGNPTSVVVGGCELANEKAKILTWGSLTVSFSDLEGRGLRLYGWSVSSASNAPRVTMPYGVRVGTSVAAARRAIPASTARFDQTFQQYNIRTRRAPDMVWSSDRRDAQGRVDYVGLNTVYCD